MLKPRSIRHSFRIIHLDCPETSGLKEGRGLVFAEQYLELLLSTIGQFNQPKETYISCRMTSHQVSRLIQVVRGVSRDVLLKYSGLGWMESIRT